jgi:hypothetical protein
MKWVTRDHLHMDRVACPWLILRRIDPDAEFLYVPFGRERETKWPEGAIPFALPGAELGPHDEEGSTFRKLLVKYNINDPALNTMARIIESGITHVFSQLYHGKTDLDALPFVEGIGLDAISLGMMMICDDDNDNIRRSLVLYDALYGYCRVLELQKNKPDLLKVSHPKRWDVMRDELVDLRQKSDENSRFK